MRNPCPHCCARRCAPSWRRTRPVCVPKDPPDRVLPYKPDLFSVLLPAINLRLTNEPTTGGQFDPPGPRQQSGCSALWAPAGETNTDPPTLGIDVFIVEAVSGSARWLSLGCVLCVYFYVKVRVLISIRGSSPLKSVSENSLIYQQAGRRDIRQYKKVPKVTKSRLILQTHLSTTTVQSSVCGVYIKVPQSTTECL